MFEEFSQNIWSEYCVAALHTIILGMDEPRWTLGPSTAGCQTQPRIEREGLGKYLLRDGAAQGFPSMGPGVLAGDTGSDRRVCFPNLIWPCQIPSRVRTFSLSSSVSLKSPPHKACSHHRRAHLAFCLPLQITKNNTELM